MPQRSTLAQGAALLAALAVTASAAPPALAQPYPPPPDRGYGPPPPGYSPGYAYGEPDVAPPEGYDDRYRSYDFSNRARDEDARYSVAVQRWAADNCINSRNDNAAAGAVIGGIFGAIVGSSVAGRHDRAAGAIIGGAVGAMAGSAIGASRTSPGCPPGYAVREGASAFAPGFAFAGGYAYAAPPGYRPWIWTGGRWVYRPYPYHRYWYRRERWRDRDQGGDWRYRDGR
jgi:hypothetical protein